MHYRAVLHRISVGLAGKSSPRFEVPYNTATLLIVFLMVASLVFFRGPKWLHLLQLLNLILLVEAGLLGSMAITGIYL